MVSSTDGAFLAALYINFGIAAAAFLIFSFLRYSERFVSTYSPMCLGPHSVERPTSFYGWVHSCFQPSQEWLVLHRGMDAVMYLRFLKSCTIFFLVLTIVAFVTIVPTNYSGSNKDLSTDDRKHVEGLMAITMSNIPEQSRKLWVHMIFLCFVTFIFMYLQHRDHKLYTQLRLMHKKTFLPENFTVLVRNIKIPTEEANLHTLKAKTNYLKNYFNQQFDNSVLFVRMVWDAKDLDALKQEEDQNQRALERTRAISVKKGPASDRTELVGNYTKELARLRSQITQKQKDNEPYLFPIAFVTFNSISKAMICAQTNFSSTGHFLAFPAEDVRSVVWENLTIGKNQAYIRGAVVGTATFFLTFFYMIPITFVQTLANLRDLANTLHWHSLTQFLDDNPGFENFFQGYVPPLILIIFMILLLPVMRFLSRLQGYGTLGEIERSTLNKYFFFLIFQVFLATTISGSVFKSLNNLINDPASIVPLFASSLPKQGLFFVTYVMLSASRALVGLLNPGRLVLVWLKQKFLCRSEREYREAELPDAFDYVAAFSNDLLILQISLTYSVMYPLILIFATTYFYLTSLVTRYSLLFTCEATFEMGGVLWPNAFLFMSVGMLITNLTMIGVFSLFQFPGTVVSIGLLTATSVFTYHVLSLYSTISTYGAIDELTSSVSDGPSTTGSGPGPSSSEQPSTSVYHHQNNALEQLDQHGADVPFHETLPLVPREIISPDRLEQEPQIIQLWYSFLQPGLHPPGVKPLPTLRLNRRAHVIED